MSLPRIPKASIVTDRIKNEDKDEQKTTENKKDEQKVDCTQVVAQYVTLLNNLLSDMQELLNLLADRSLKAKPNFKCLDYDFYPINPVLTRYIVKGIKEECKNLK
ncbi:hypothetical protein STSV2_70 [Sulfolobus virus STSV2]|uniref:hypothetical protein n=1 Tax=Sulfolobus virus STSV2 TaxID=1123964 RepID=UPI0002A81C67|nr:hypothetical protein STSV2_70 [Sulfolobus virus STSV2]AFU92049.1 hypothetical protein STSV2_70 [Sulfolobus virus STSV2]